MSAIDTEQIKRGFEATSERMRIAGAPGSVVYVTSKDMSPVTTFTCAGCGSQVLSGHKCDTGKLEWDLFPFDAAEGIVRVLMYGKKKYAAHQWRTGGGIGISRAIRALLRHVFAWLKGEDLDPESGLHHLDHAGCELLFALHSLRTGKGDERSGFDQARGGGA